MKNIALILEYIGTGYSGYQKQKNGLSVQEVLENALSTALNENIKTVASGRTDAGVHAYGQVVNFKTATTIAPGKIAIVANFKLPNDVKIIKSFEVPTDFSSRFSAKKKTYIYRIETDVNVSVFDNNLCYHFPYKLDIEKMNKACMLIKGEHDFSSFMATGSKVKDTIRTIFSAKFMQYGAKVIFEICGNGFLYNMVRILVGTFLEVGTGKMELENLTELLKGNQRFKAGKTVPACGLFLKEVSYQ